MLRKISSCVAMAAALMSVLLNGGCGSSSANTVTVTLSQPTATLVVTQVLNLTATVAGSTNLNVTWTCTFTTTTTTTASDGTTSSTTSTAAPCTSSTGVLSNIQPTTVTFTAPTKITTPPPTSTTTTSPPTVTVTATSVGDTKKTGTCVVTLDSGVTVGINPANAAVPTSQNFQFVASITNDTIPNDVTWSLTQEPTSTTNLQTATTCSPTCGTISTSGIYTAPASVPTANTPSTITTTTPQSLTIIATSKLDSTRFGIGTITIVPTGPITFRGISPNIAPQGGVLQDVYLAATNVNSLTSIFYDGLALPSTQVLVISPPTAGATPTGARARLSPAQLAVAGPHTIGICNPPIGQSTCAPNSVGGPFTLTVSPVRPALIATSPDSLPQTTGPSGGALTMDGGYFGGPTAPLVSAKFNGSPVVVAAPTSRQISLTMPPLPTAGLFPISVTNNNASPTSAVTNLAVFPDYSASNPASLVAVPAPAVNPIPLAGAATPSAIAIDDTLDVAVITEAGTNSVEYLNLNAAFPTLIPGRIPVGSVPTGVAVDDVLHYAAVINYADRSMWLLSIPAAGQTPSATPVAKIDLSNLIPTVAPTTPPTPPPFPYSVGIDPFTHLAVVAFASTNIGFIADINPANKANKAECIVPGQAPPCVISSVTLNTGQYPQVALEPRIHLAYVTPGGAGTLSVVDLTQKSTSIGIATASRSSNVVTITTTTAHNINPGNPGTILISGVSTKNTNFNGPFSGISVIDNFNFSYSQTAANDSVTGGTASSPIGQASYGTAFLTFNISPTMQGISINPISRTAMLSDPNATDAQVNFISTLDESVSALSLTQGSLAGSTTSGPPEIRDTNVAFQPYSNSAVMHNPQLNQLSLIDPTRLQRYQILSTAPVGGAPTNGMGSVTIASTGTALAFNGALAVDPTTNLALAVNSGSNNISVFALGTIKPVHIGQVLLTSGGVPGANFPQATLTTNSTPTAGVPVNIRIIGTGFEGGGGTAAVRLDAVALPSATVVSNTEIDATIPASFLTVPRHYALDVLAGGIGSNATDFTVVQTIGLGSVCSSGNPQPAAVAIDTTKNVAVVSNNNCNSISFIDLTPGAATPLQRTTAVGTSPVGIDVIPRLGYAVVANNGDGTASIVNMNTGTVVSSPGTGTNPTGVAINPYTGAALVTNTGSNSISEIDLTSITSSTSTPTVETVGIDQQPLAIAIDPNRPACSSSTATGIGIAVVTAVEISAAGSTGVLDTVDISTGTPVQCTTTTTPASVTTTPTGVVFDPSVSPAVFYAVSSEGNSIYTFNPDTSTATPTNVGINPTSLAVNYNTGTLLTVNSASNTISVVDTQTMKTRATFGVTTSSTAAAVPHQFAAAIHPLTNMAVVTDQVNNRVLLVPLPN